jgi:NADPH-dependent glutamate synthase beta subunit-like oxidoreductase
MNAPLPIPPIWTTGTTEGIHTGTWRAATPRHIAAPSPCHQACPVGGEIARWIGQARAGDLQGAWETLVRHNPFPAIAGRICHHPCESACNRGGHDEVLSICRLERYVGDAAIEQGWAVPVPALPHAGRVAVVGGGPAGLSAAWQLRRLGHAVTIFEAADELGGVMRHGIPAYRLSRRVLDAEIARVVELGVEVRCGQAVQGEAAFAALARDFDAVFVALGAQRPRGLPQLDDGKPWVMDGARYLAACSRGAPPPLGRRVVVVGGGSAAIDVARSARRQGHAVTLLALEREGADAGAARRGGRGAGRGHRAGRRRDAARRAGSGRSWQRGRHACPAVRACRLRARRRARQLPAHAHRRQRLQPGGRCGARGHRPGPAAGRPG